MNQIILHRGEQYIQEDLEYYFSSERDKNNQIRPDTSVYSMTPFSEYIDSDYSNNKVCTFFDPQLPSQLDRIYIGISVSLFANHWGASFLIELLKLVKPGGAIILPVYPEGQAGEKGYWSRSFLEDVFLSRSRWSGLSNVNAENDGVMSLRVGKKWPKPHPSAIGWFYKERSNVLLRSIQTNNDVVSARNSFQETFRLLSKLIWQEYSHSAIIEKIIHDYCGPEKMINVINISRDYGLLNYDLMLSPQINIVQGISFHIGPAIPSIIDSLSSYFSPITDNRHELYQRQDYDDLFIELLDVIILRDAISEIELSAYELLVKEAWSHLNTNGILILFEDLSNTYGVIAGMDKLLNELGSVKYYSAIVASSIEEDITISQYSLAVEEDLRQESNNKQTVFRVLQKDSQAELQVK